MFMIRTVIAIVRSSHVLISPLGGKLWRLILESVITLADCYHNCSGRAGGSLQLQASRNRRKRDRLCPVSNYTLAFASQPSKIVEHLSQGN